MRVTLEEWEKELETVEEELERRPEWLAAADEKVVKLEHTALLAHEEDVRIRDMGRETVESLRGQAKLQATKTAREKLFSLKETSSESNEEVPRVKNELKPSREKKLMLTEEYLTAKDETELRTLSEWGDEVKHKVTYASRELAALERKLHDMKGEYRVQNSDGYRYPMLADILVEIVENVEEALHERKSTTLSSRI
ncbi:UNVERIFIED_CONTAM: hypothetical protein HHA_451460 [Hammondia hammondi]|eukprot:XP_008884299.1 hypothetical protein HHA_451460 [Hammondia hammondi]